MNKGQKVLIFKGNQRIGIGKVQRLTATQCVISRERGNFCGASYMLKSHQEVGGDKHFQEAGEATLAAAHREFDLELERKEEEKRLERERQYKALPEEVKLARKVRWKFDVASEKTVAGMPIDLLRQLAAWCDTVSDE